MLGKSRKGQIAFEFVIVYTLILVVFILFFALITSQRATSIQSEQEASLQLIAQNIATDINQALISGSGYSATIQLPQSVTGSPYNVYVSTTGVVIVNTTIGTQTFSTYAFSNARNLVINGKKLPTSANSIQIYELPTSPASYNITSNTINLFLAQQYSSQFYISNYHGTLFIDKQSPNNINYAKNAYANVESSDFAIFNGYDSLISVANSNVLNPSNAVTLSAWVYPEKYSTDNRNGGGIISKSTQYEISINASGYAVVDGKLPSTPVYSNVKVPLDGWSFIAGTLNSNGTATICVNAVCKSNSSTGSSLLVTSNSLYIGFGSILGGGATTPSPGAATYFNGSIANAQVYNDQLSTYQISSLYQEGINGIPLTQNLSGWWPLNLTTQDFSGNGNYGTPSNILYGNVSQISMEVLSNSGIPMDLTGGKTRVGVTVSNGVVFGLNKSISLLTNASLGGNRNAVAFATFNHSNLSINVFNGDSSLVGNLAAWYPLDSGYGNTIYDLSGNYNNAVFGSFGRAPLATWINEPENEINARNGNFNGYNSLISVANSNVLNPTNAVTLSAWVYPEKYSADNRNGGGIISKNKQYEISINASGYAVIDGVLHSTPFYSNIKVPLNKWSFIAGTLNSNGTATICVNAACKSNSSTAGSLLITGEPLYIGFGSILGGGATTPLPGAATYFNGSIANAQVYNNQLSQYQISSLYQEGINGIPLTQNLSGWWPLDGNANDYSRNKDNGIAENVTFDNYAFTANNPAAYAPYFNVGDYAESSNAPKITSQITVCGWINYNTPNNAYIGGQYESFMIGNSRLALNGVKSNIYTNGMDIHISTNGKRNGEMEFSGGNTFTPGTWHFICGEYTGSNYLGFIDGVQVFNESGPQFNTNLGNIWIGGDSFGGGMSGSIEGVQIYNTSITPSQVLQLYYQGLPVSEK